MVTRVRALAVVTSGLAAIAACGQVLGIKDVHDDPVDAGAADATRSDGPAPDVVGDAVDGATGDGAMDTGRDAPLDARGDAAIDGAVAPDPALGCPGGDAGFTRFMANVGRNAPPTVAVDETNVFVAPAESSMFRCSVEGCDAGLSTLTIETVGGLATNGRHLIWTTNTGAGQLHVSNPDGTDVLVKNQGGGSSVVTAGTSAYVLAGGNIIPLYDGPGGVDASSMPFLPPPGNVFEIAASPVDLAFSATADAGVTAVQVCSPGNCFPSIIEDTQILVGTGAMPPVLVAVDDTSVYWSDPLAQTINACSLSGCTGSEQPLVTQVTVTSLFVDATGLYWSAGTPPAFTVTKASLDGGSPRTVGNSGAFIGSVVANSRCIYWSTRGNIGANTLGSVWAAPQP